MDIINKHIMKRSHDNEEKMKKSKTTPQKKAKQVSNFIGTNYEDTDYMVCSICIKVFKTNDKYLLHMDDHQKKLSLKDISIMKVFKEVPKNAAGSIDKKVHYKRTKDSQIVSTASIPTPVPAPSTSTSSNAIVSESYGGIFSIAQATVKLGLSETLGDTIKTLATTIKTINSRVNLQGTNNITITTDAFRRAIKAMSNNIRDRLLKRVLQSPYFTLHLAEFLDIKNFETLIVTIRYKYETKIEEEILLCQRLNATPVDEIYLVTSNFLSNYQLDWTKCIAISMDGVRSQCEPLKHFIKFIFSSGLAPSLTCTFSRRGQLIKQLLPDILAETLTDAIAMVNILKTDSTLNFDHDMEDGYQQILYHSDEYWLSHGRMLSRLFEMRDQCLKILESSRFKDKMSDTNWLHKLAYLVDIFECFSKLNRDLQTENFSTFHIYDKITFMVDLLKMYRTDVEQQNFTQFLNVQQLLAKEPQRNVKPDVLSAILENLRCLQNSMNRYLPIASEIENSAWIRNPFDVRPDNMPPNLSTDEKELLLNLKKDGFIVTKFDENKLDHFWALADKNYHTLAIKAMKYLLIFKSSQLSEKGFATLVDIRTKMLTDLEYEESYVRIKQSNIEPDFTTLLLPEGN